jgi:hypothetical protein
MRIGLEGEVGDDPSALVIAASEQQGFKVTRSRHHVTRRSLRTRFGVELRW